MITIFKRDSHPWNIYRWLALGFALLLSSGATRQPPQPAEVFGRIQFVEHFPDVKVKVVEHFSDLKVKRVKAFANGPGEWQIVNSLPDYKVQLVDHFPDFTIQWVDAFPGVK